MKPIVILMLCLFVGPLAAQNDIDLVRKNLVAQSEAWNRGDIEGFMAYYWKSDSLTFVAQSGVTYGWQNTIGRYLKSYPDKASMGHLLFNVEQVQQLDANHIYMIGRWQLEKEKPAGGFFTLLWRRINGQWLIVSDHTS